MYDLPNPFSWSYNDTQAGYRIYRIYKHTVYQLKMFFGVGIEPKMMDSELHRVQLQLG